MECHQHTVFTAEAFVPQQLGSTILPAIDPFTSKNAMLPAYLARETVAELGIDLFKPLVIQVSRFDPWKDPHGVVEVWRRVVEAFPDLQLAPVGSMADDDPEGWRIYEEIERETHAQPNCFLLTNQVGVGSHEVNALQRMADVVIQKSVREGFGLIVSEALWKGTAVVAAPAGGIPTQIEDGVNGYLAGSVDEFADRVHELLENPDRARQLGAAGALRVREQFLLTRLLRDHLTFLKRALGA